VIHGEVQPVHRAEVAEALRQIINFDVEHWELFVVSNW
jgi:hypothetical protein